MPPRDDEPRGSPAPIAPRPADEEQARLRPKMGRRARDRLASVSPAAARRVVGGHGKRERSRAPVRELPEGVGPGRHARRVVIQAHVHRMRAGPHYMIVGAIFIARMSYRQAISGKNMKQARRVGRSTRASQLDA